MKALATFVMRGRVQAMSMATLLACLALAVSLTPALAVLLGPLLSVASAAVVALVALRHGPWEGLYVMGAGLLAAGVLGGLLLNLGFGLGMVLALGLLWVPPWFLGLTLRSTRRLGLAVEAALLSGVLIVLGQYLLLDNPAAFWTALVKEILSDALLQAGVSEAEGERTIAMIGAALIGELGRAWFLQMTLALLLARYWQAMLYNPGGFRAEFHGLQLDRWVLLVAPVLLLGGSIGGVPMLSHLSLVFMSALFLQGVAVVHVLVASRGGGRGWLIGFYSLLFIGMQPVFTAVSAMGFADGWLGIRNKMANGPDKGADE